MLYIKKPEAKKELGSKLLIKSKPTTCDSETRMSEDLLSAFDSAGRIVLPGDEISVTSRGDKIVNKGKVISITPSKQGPRLSVEFENGGRMSFGQKQINETPDRLISETAIARKAPSRLKIKTHTKE